MACIGGGRSAGDGIRLVKGTYEMACSGINVVCIGSSLGDAFIRIGKVNLKARAEGNEVLVIGSVSGRTEIVSSGVLDLSTACERATGIGTLSGVAEITLRNGTASVTLSCDSGAAVGTFSGEYRTLISNTRLRIHGEGNQLVGLGSLMGAGETRVESGEIRGSLLSAEHKILGNSQSRCVVTGGNFLFAPDSSVRPVSPDGSPLGFCEPIEDHFECAFRDSQETWTYTADRSAEGKLGIYIPR